jgi:RNA polymerase sigma-70 factor (ECF subfamily)
MDAAAELASLSSLHQNGAATACPGPRGAEPRIAEAEFAQLVREVIPALGVFARSLTRSVSAGDDVVQEALMRAWAARDRFEPGSNFRAWIFRIARNSFLTEQRKAWRNVEWNDLRDDARLIHPPMQEDRLYGRDLERLLQGLRPEQRDALELVVGQGLTYEEAAALSGVVAGTLKSRVGRARAILSRHLSDASRFGQRTAEEFQAAKDGPALKTEPSRYARWMTDAADLVGRGADIGLLHDVGGLIGVDMGPQPGVQPSGVAAIQAVEAGRRFAIQLFDVRHRTSPVSIGVGNPRAAARPRLRAEARATAADKRLARRTRAVLSDFARGFQAPVDPRADREA